MWYGIAALFLAAIVLAIFAYLTTHKSHTTKH